MGMIKAQGDREQAMSEAEWKQLSNLIENDRQERVSRLVTCIDCDLIQPGIPVKYGSVRVNGCTDDDCIHSTVQYGYNNSERMHSKVQHGYNNNDRMHSLPPCALSATKKTSALVSIYMCCTSNCKHAM